MTALNKFSSLKQSDRLFVSAVLDLLYNGDESEIRNRVLKKRSNSKPGAKVVTPEKLNKIHELMQTRIQRIIDPNERLQRQQPQYINYIISEALGFARK